MVGKGLSTLGKGLAPAIIARDREIGVHLAAEISGPGADLPPSRIVSVLRDIAGHFFPLLITDAKTAHEFGSRLRPARAGG